MIDALIKRVSVTYKYYEMYAHRGKIVQLLVSLCYFDHNETLLLLWQQSYLKLFKSQHG
jgi:hypothetical protein